MSPLILLLLACASAEPELGSGAYNQDNNGVWMRRVWMHQPHTDAEIQALAATLRARGITQLYPFLGPLGADGPGWRDGNQVRAVNPALAGAFLAAIKKADPALVVLPWSGGVLNRDVPLKDTEYRSRFSAEMAKFTAMGADGVQLNVEPMSSGYPGYLELLTEVKAAIGPDKILSIAAYPPVTPLHDFPDVHWDLPFLAQVCQAADDIAVMAYDTALTDTTTYQGLVADWTAQLAATLPAPEAGGCTWRVGVPAYEDEAPWHHPDAETLRAALDGVAEGLARAPIPVGFRGVAVYASWTTDAAEWADYDRRWRGKTPVDAGLMDYGQTPAGQ